MVRMWMIDPRLMCRQHLLGEHNELHKLVGSLKKGRSILGYVKKGYVSTVGIKDRHEELALEMRRRGYRHESPLDYEEAAKMGKIDVYGNMKELSSRCEDCRRRIHEILEC